MALTTDDEPSPYEVTYEQRVFRLRRYYAGRRTGRPRGGRASNSPRAAAHAGGRDLRRVSGDERGEPPCTRTASTPG